MVSISRGLETILEVTAKMMANSFYCQIVCIQGRAIYRVWFQQCYLGGGKATCLGEKM